MPSISNLSHEMRQPLTPASTLVERYGPLHLIGEGSSSTVYKGYDRVQCCEVAVKAIHYAGGLERFLRVEQEVTALKKLNYPSIIRVFDVVRETPAVYVVTEFIYGEPLSALIARIGALPPDQAIVFMIKIAEALSHVHQRGLIHRDLKPSNIICGPTDDVKLLDFGLSWITSVADRLWTNRIVGTLAYMAPEQTGVLDIPIDGRADLYSLGVLYYEILTGVRPFCSMDPSALIHQQVAQIPQPPHRVKPAIEPILSEIVMKLLRKAPQERYQTADGLVKDLKEYLHLSSSDEPAVWFELGTGEAERRSHSFYTTLIGRGQNQRELQGAFEAAAAGIGQAIMFSGEPGIGKSRLVHEHRAFATGHGGIFISGKCTEYSAVFPYSPFAEAVEEYVRQVSQLPAAKRAVVIDGIKQVVGHLGADITMIFPSIKALIGSSAALHPHDWEPEKDVERFLNVASDLLISLSSEMLPVVMFWDDLQWIDGGSLKLLERTMPKLKNSHLMFVGAYRDTQLEADHVLKGFLSIWRHSIRECNLKGLSHQDVETLLQKAVGQPTQDLKEVARVIWENTAGNPFFILETVKALVQSDVLSDHGERLTVDLFNASGLATTLEVDQVIVHRLQSVSALTRDILRCAAVIGRHFTFDSLVQLKADPIQILDSLEEAIQKNIIMHRSSTGPVGGYSFVHDKILESLYTEMDESVRQRLHQYIGEVIEQSVEEIDKEAGPATVRRDAIFELALHFRRGNVPLKAMKYGLKAARLAERTYANAEAAQSYETILELLNAGHVLPIEDMEGKNQEEFALTIREALGDAYALLGRYNDAKFKYSEVRRVLGDPDQRLPRCRVETKIGTACFKQGHTEKTLEHFGAALSALGIRQPNSTLGVVLSLLSESVKQMFRRFIRPRACTPRDTEALRLSELLINYYYFIDMRRCFQVHMKQLNLAERIGSEAYCRVAYGLHQNLCNAIGLHGRALRYAERSMALVRALEQRNDPDTYGLAILDSSVSALGRAYYYVARYDKAVHYLSLAGEETLKRGNLWDTEVAYGMLCMAYFGQGQFENMLKCAKALHRIADGVKDVRGLGWAYVLQGLVYSHQGRMSEACDYAQQAVKHSRKVGDQLIRVMSLRVLGQIYLKNGDIRRAIRTLELSRAVIMKHQLLHDFVTGTFVILGEAYCEAACRFADRQHYFKKRAKTALIIGRWLARLFPNWRAHALRAAGSYELMLGRERKGFTLLHRSIATAEQLGMHYDAAKAHSVLGNRLRKQYDSEGAASLDRARTLMSDIGRLPGLSELSVPSVTEGRSQELAREDQRIISLSREFEVLLRVCREISVLQDIDSLLEHILEAATEVVGAERGYLLLNVNGNLQVKIVKGLDPQEYNSEAFQFSRSLIHEVESEKKPILTTDARADPRFTEHQSIHRYGLRSILCVPMLRRDKVLGILYLDNRLLPDLFTDRHLELILAFAGQAAIAIENASSYRELSSEKLKLEALTLSLDQKIREKTADLQDANAQLQEANDKLSELDKSKSAFVSMVSHELRTPLTSCRLLLDNLLAGIVGPVSEKQASYVQRCIYNIERLTRMVHDLLDLATIEAGRVQLRLEPLPLPEVLMEVVENMQPAADAKQITLSGEHTGAPDTVRADRDKFHQILINLIANALKFTKPGGKIHVRSELAGSDVKFSVSDTGCGIGEDEIGKVFERFYRGEKVSAEQRGAGLGLAICKSLVKHHGGEIWVESVLGKGTSFYFTLSARDRPD
jgi:signal transduction histidine kinase/tetratricopeptide (TPR) repeat protein